MAEDFFLSLKYILIEPVMNVMQIWIYKLLKSIATKKKSVLKSFIYIVKS